MADICGSCGGVLGRDCFNPSECAWITADMQARAHYDRMEADLYAEMRAASLRSGPLLQGNGAASAPDPINQTPPPSGGAGQGQGDGPNSEEE